MSAEKVKDGKKVVTFTASDGSKSKKTIPTTPNPNAVSMAGGEGGKDRLDDELSEMNIREGIDEQFPTGDLIKPDKRDAIMAAKIEMQTDPEKPGVTPLGVMQATDKDFQYVISKRDQEVEANFQQWFATYFDHASPEEKEWARKAFPSFYEQRRRKLRRDVEELGKNAELKLMGIQTQEDLFRQYAIESGLIAADPLENIMHPERAQIAQNKELRQQNFARGLLNPRRLVRGDPGIIPRQINAEMMLNRQMPYKAYAAGTGAGTNKAVGFSAQGLVTSETEKDPNMRGTFDSVIRKRGI